MSRIVLLCCLSLFAACKPKPKVFQFDPLAPLPPVSATPTPEPVEEPVALPEESEGISAPLVVSDGTDAVIEEELELPDATPLPALDPPASDEAPEGSLPPIENPKQSGQELQIRLYRTYASKEQQYIRARIVRPEKAGEAGSDDSGWRNFWRNFEGLTVSEVADVQVRFILGDKEVLAVSDAEGMIDLTTTELTPEGFGFVTLRAEVLGEGQYWAPPAEYKLPVHSKTGSTLAVVSDIDDTLKRSDVANKVKAATKLLFGNPYTTEDIPGMAKLLMLLEERDQRVDGDVFYLSGSPLNLSGDIYTFLDLKGFPHGAVELKKWGFEEGDENPLVQQGYKLEKLRKLLAFYPEKQFIFFGDSSEADAEIYLTIAEEYPGRVREIFIHNVTEAQANDPKYEGVYLVSNTFKSAQILHAKGWLNEEEFNAFKAYWQATGL